MLNFDFRACDSWQCINSFAPWFTALGTITISGLSLWLAIKDKLVRVSGIFRLAMIPSDVTNTTIINRNVFVLNFVNVGIRKVKITNFMMCIHSGLFKKNYLVLFPQLDESLKHINPNFPIQLDEMDSKDLFFDENFFLNLNEKSRKHLFYKNKFYTWYKIQTAYFILNTTIKKDIKIPIHQEAKRKLWKQYTKTL